MAHTARPRWTRDCGTLHSSGCLCYHRRHHADCSQKPKTPLAFCMLFLVAAAWDCPSVTAYDDSSPASSHSTRTDGSTTTLPRTRSVARTNVTAPPANDGENVAETTRLPQKNQTWLEEENCNDCRNDAARQASPRLPDWTYTLRWRERASKCSSPRAAGHGRARFFLTHHHSHSRALLLQHGASELVMHH